jgi:hypothetical protein
MDAPLRSSELTLVAVVRKRAATRSWKRMQAGSPMDQVGVTIA